MRRRSVQAADQQTCCGEERAIQFETLTTTSAASLFQLLVMLCLSERVNTKSSTMFKSGDDITNDTVASL